MSFFNKSSGIEIKTIADKIRHITFKSFDAAIIEERWVPVVGGYQPKEEPDQRFDLANNIIDSFVGHPKRDVLLLVGSSGSGKTWFGQSFVVQLWRNWEEGKVIPLWVSLINLTQSAPQLLKKHLKTLQDLASTEEDALTDEEIKFFIQAQPPLLIVLDGYDELSTEQRQINFYQENHWQHWKNPIKVMITSRSEALPESCKITFGSERSDGYIERHIQLFDEHQLEAFVTLFINDPHYEPQEGWDGNRYLHVLHETPELKEFIGKPFLLKMVLQAWPSIDKEVEEAEKNNDTLQKQKLTREKLYERFLKRHYEREAKRLSGMGKTTKIKNAYLKKTGKEIEIADLLELWMQNFARACFIRNINSVEWIPKEVLNRTDKLSFQKVSEISFSKSSSNEPKKLTNPEWLSLFFDEEHEESFPYVNDLLTGCPIIRIGKYRYTFLHLSILEYYAAKHLFNGVIQEAWLLVGHNLNAENLQKKPEIMEFLIDRVVEEYELSETEQSFTNALWGILEQSKYEPSVWKAAANAITILNYAGISFSGRDLKRIRIGGVDETTGETWGADLSYGIFDHTDLSESDLRYSKAYRIWLRHADLSYACMDGVDFGEVGRWKGDVFHVFAEETKILVHYHREGAGDDGEGFLSLRTSTIYDLSQTQHQVPIVLPLSKAINIPIAHANKWLLVSDEKRTQAELWNLETVQCVWNSQKFKGLFDFKVVALSPDGKQLACRNLKQSHTFLLWDIETNKNKDIWEDIISDNKTENTNCAFSSTGQFLVSFHADVEKNCCNLSIWESHTGMCRLTLENNYPANIWVDISHDDQWFLVVTPDSLECWQLSDGTPKWVSDGHFDGLRHIALSENDQKLLVLTQTSLSIWDVQSGKQLWSRFHETNHYTRIYFLKNTTEFIAVSVRRLDVLSVQEGTVLSNYPFNEAAKSIYATQKGDFILSCNDEIEDSKTQFLRAWAIRSSLQKRALNLDLTREFGHANPSASLDKNWEYIGDDYLWMGAPTEKMITLQNQPWVGHEIIAFSPNGRFILFKKELNKKDIADRDQIKVCLYCLEMKKYIWRHQCRDLHDMSFSQDSEYLAVVLKEGLIDFCGLYLIQMGTGYVKQLQGSYCDASGNISFSPNGQYLVGIVGGLTTQLKLYFTETAQEFACLLNVSFLTKCKIFWIDSNRFLMFNAATQQTPTVIEICEGSHTKFIQVIQFSQTYVTLNTVRLNIHQVTGLADNTISFFHQMSREVNVSLIDSANSIIGMVGIVFSILLNEDNLKSQSTLIGTPSDPSRRTTQQVLEARNSQVYISEGSYRQNWGGDHFIINQNRWVVGIVRKKNDVQSNHIWLMLQGLDQNNYTVIQEFHLFLDENEPKQLGGMMGKGLIQIRYLSPYDLIEKAEKLCVRFWKIDSETREILVANVEAYQRAGVNYWIGGRAPDPNTFNCLSWCETMLESVGINPNEKPEFLDYLFAIPSRYLPTHEQEQEKKCLVM